MNRKRLGICIIALVVVSSAAFMFQWQYDTLISGDVSRLVRVNRFTSEVQVFSKTRGWVPVEARINTPCAGSALDCAMEVLRSGN